MTTLNSAFIVVLVYGILICWKIYKKSYKKIYKKSCKKMYKKSCKSKPSFTTALDASITYMMLFRTQAM